MRITEGQLRRIIREELLNEGAMTPSDALGSGMRFEAKVDRDFADVQAYMKEGGGHEIRVGSLSAAKTDNPCSGAWQVYWSSVTTDRLGPLLYDIMIDLVYPDPLMSDRTSVSLAAKRVWDYYFRRRYDIEEEQLDDLGNTLTVTDRDNCEQWSAMNWADDIGGAWPESSLSKAYRRADGGTPMLDELRDLGIIDIVKR